MHKAANKHASHCKVNQNSFDMNHNVMHYPEMCASSRIPTNQYIERPDNTWTGCLTSQESGMCSEYYSENNDKKGHPTSSEIPRIQHAGP